MNTILTADGLFKAVMIDEWPSLAAVVDFGIEKQKEYEAYYYPIRKGEITLKQLRDNVGNGPALTKLLQAAPSNPHKDITISTFYDEMRITKNKCSR
jgi:hypothetical protein